MKAPPPRAPPPPLPDLLIPRSPDPPMTKPPVGQAEGKREQVEAMFDEIAPRYDLLNRVLSFGTDVWWRKRAVAFLGEALPFRPRRLLDVATGTADLAVEALSLKPDEVVGVDISEGMLRLAAQKLAYLRPGMYLRHLLASGTALKAWLFAAIKLTSPQFPVAPELEGAVLEATSVLEAGLQGQARDHLTRVVSKLLASGAALDLKRWVAAVDLTADRAGLIVAHDLDNALALVRAADESSSSVPVERRVQELILYSVSPAYLAIRLFRVLGLVSTVHVPSPDRRRARAGVEEA